MDVNLKGAAIVTLALREARNAVKAQWAAQGIRRWDYRDLAKAARDYLDQNRDELFANAEVLLAKIEVMNNGRGVESIQVSLCKYRVQNVHGGAPGSGGPKGQALSDHRTSNPLDIEWVSGKGGARPDY